LYSTNKEKEKEKSEERRNKHVDQGKTEKGKGWGE